MTFNSLYIYEQQLLKGVFVHSIVCSTHRQPIDTPKLLFSCRRVNDSQS